MPPSFWFRDEACGSACRSVEAIRRPARWRTPVELIVAVCSGGDVHTSRSDQRARILVTGIEMHDRTVAGHPPA